MTFIPAKPTTLFGVKYRSRLEAVCVTLQEC